VAVSKEAVKDGQTGPTFLKVDLLENSAVPIPANPKALRRAFTEGIASEDFLAQHFFSMRDEILVRHTDIFIPKDWHYKDSLNAMAELALEIKTGQFSVNKTMDKVVEPKLEAYHCEFCGKDAMVEENSFEKKTYDGIEYRNIQCPSCEATVEQCLQGVELLLQQTSSKGE